MFGKASGGLKNLMPCLHLDLCQFSGVQADSEKVTMAAFTVKCRLSLQRHLDCDNANNLATGCSHLSASTLQELHLSRLAAVHIRQFATPAECQRLCQALRHAAIDRRAATTSPMT